MRDEIISLPRALQLHPSIRQEVIDTIRQLEAGMIADNLAIRIVQGLRTIEEQDELYAKGRTAPGPKVTNAPGGSSMHNYGLAFDFCFLFKNEAGKFVYDEKKSWLVGPNHHKVVSAFKQLGYTWGGDFKSIPDSPHLEKNFGFGWRALFAKHQQKNFVTESYVNVA